MKWLKKILNMKWNLINVSTVDETRKLHYDKINTFLESKEFMSKYNRVATLSPEKCIELCQYFDHFLSSNKLPYIVKGYNIINRGFDTIHFEIQPK